MGRGNACRNAMDGKNFTAPIPSARTPLTTRRIGATGTPDRTHSASAKTPSPNAVTLKPYAPPEKNTSAREAPASHTYTGRVSLRTKPSTAHGTYATDMNHVMPTARLCAYMPFNTKTAADTAAPTRDPKISRASAYAPTRPITT